MEGGRLVRPRNLEFFRVLLPGFESRLPLPSLFADHFMEDNGTWATLWSPLCKCWHVKVHRDSKSLSFADGWQKFAADHRLSTGDFLVFIHKGGLVFNVAIFDQTTCERNFDSIATSEVKRKRIPREDNNSSRKGNCEDAFDYSKRVRTSSLGKRVAEAIETDPRKCQEHIAQHQNHKPLTTKNRQARGPHQCKVVMKKHHNRNHLDLPIGFGASNGLSGIRQLFLRDPKGQVWPTRLCHKMVGSKIRSAIYCGWKAFCVGNNLTGGDSCLFEFKGNNELHVQIYRRRGLRPKGNVSKRTSKRVKGPLCNPTETEMGKPAVQSRSGQDMKRKAEHGQASEPSDTCAPGTQFMCTIFPSSLVRLTIPKAFRSSVDISALRRIILVDSRSRRWHVRIYHQRVGISYRVRLSLGWRTFCIENNVQVGDVCVFKPGTSEGNDVFHVQVVKPVLQSQSGQAMSGEEDYGSKGV